MPRDQLKHPNLCAEIVNSTAKTLADLTVFASLGVILPNLLWGWGFFGCVVGGLVWGLWMKWITRSVLQRPR